MRDLTKQYPKLLEQALDRIKSGESEEQAATWVWFHGATENDRNEVDIWLVLNSHPLASQPGSKEWRFRRLVENQNFYPKPT
jgi:hypothetical protein